MNAQIGPPCVTTKATLLSMDASKFVPLFGKHHDSEQGHQSKESECSSRDATIVHEKAAALSALPFGEHGGIHAAYHIQLDRICEDMRRKYDENKKNLEIETTRWMEEERQAREEALKLGWSEAMTKIQAYYAHDLEKRMVKVEKEKKAAEEERNTETRKWEEERKGWSEEKEKLERMALFNENNWQEERGRLCEEKKMLEEEYRGAIQCIVNDANKSLEEATLKFNDKCRELSKTISQGDSEKLELQERLFAKEAVMSKLEDEIVALKSNMDKSKKAAYCKVNNELKRFNVAKEGHVLSLKRAIDTHTELRKRITELQEDATLREGQFQDKEEQWRVERNTAIRDKEQLEKEKQGAIDDAKLLHKTRANALAEEIEPKLMVMLSEFKKVQIEIRTMRIEMRRAKHY